MICGGSYAHPELCHGGGLCVIDFRLGLTLRGGDSRAATDPGRGVRSLANLTDHHRAYGRDDPVYAFTHQ